MEYINKLDKEMLLDAEKEKGINQGGITSGISYEDAAGNIRHKYETNKAFSTASIEKIRISLQPPEDEAPL